MEHATHNEVSGINVNLNDFIGEFKSSLLESLNNANPPVYLPQQASLTRQAMMDRLIRKPFSAQAHVVQAISALLIDQNEPAGIINAEMGTGKVRRTGA